MLPKPAVTGEGPPRTALIFSRATGPFPGQINRGNTT